jgi:multiple sugar transport system permease protein
MRTTVKKFNWKHFSLFKNSGASTLTFRAWEFTGTAMVNLFIFTLLAAYLSPLLYMVATSLKEKQQFLDSSAPFYPARQVEFEYEGKSYPLLEVPTEQGIQQWAIINRTRTSAEFIDPANPETGLIAWQGNWRELKKVYQPHITFDNFTNLWTAAKFPLTVKNTLIIAVISEIGVLLASIAVAYGFSRFRIPGGKWLFLLLIATILIPESITLVPTYFVYARVFDWNGTWYPLIVPHLFGNAIYIFLLRQNFKSIPKDLDEAAMLDGAGPLRILFSIILPQAIPAVATVALLHFFYTWNELRLASLYLGIAPNLRTVSFNVQTYQSLTFTPEMLQAGALLVMIVPVLVLFVFQRFFMQDMVVTGMEK